MRGRMVSVESSSATVDNGCAVTVRDGMFPPGRLPRIGLNSMSNDTPDELRPGSTGTHGRGLVPFLLCAVFAANGCAPSLQEGDPFARQPLVIADYGLFDLGIADVNQDSLLDIFTSNHSGPQSILINRGAGQFADGFSSLRLDQDGKFPGLAVVPREPDLSRPGLYINWRGPYIVVRTHGLSGSDKIAGTIRLVEPSKVAIEGKQNFEVIVKADPIANDLLDTVLEFSAQGNGYFTFKPYIHAQAIRFELISGLTPGRIYVGPGQVSPASLGFSIDMRDRHGMAWADYNGDGSLDVFITRGGQSGLMWKMPGMYWDELLLQEAGGFRDVGRAYGLAKSGCSGRQAAWVDVDGDNRLDLYIVCGRGLQLQANQLYRQTEDGRFVEVAGQAGLAIAEEGIFEWIDTDDDGDLDLFWADRDAFYLYLNTAGRFAAIRLGDNPARRIPAHLTVSDFDADGDFDVFAAAQGGNTLAISQDGAYVISAPGEWGLPPKSAVANWVDYDNDGREDLHVIPGGLFRQGADGKFSRTQVLGVKPGGRFSPVSQSDARASWFDADNDGARDVIVALDFTIKKNRWAPWLARLTGAHDRLGGLQDFWEVAYFRNMSANGNHWLQVQLVGPPGNRPAIGAKVSVATPQSRQTRLVGAADGSRYSQGHYRLYFGLGAREETAAITVTWPDGLVQQIEAPRADQLLVVEWPGAAKVSEASM